MKAERRHELQQNTLAKVLDDLPLYLRFHANKILVGIIVICLIFLLVRHRMNATATSRDLARGSLVDARIGIENLKRVDQTQPNDMAKLSERKKLIEQVDLAIGQILDNTSDPDDSAVRAEAIVLRGDLHWAIANLPPLAGAATLPVTAAMPTTRQSLDEAEAAYRDVLKQYPNQQISRVASLFSLAAVAENRAEWDKAAEQYKAILDDPNIPGLYKDSAQLRSAVLETIRRPTYLGRFSSTQPLTDPTTQPATQPAVETAISAPSTSAPTTTSNQ